tara:strand:- start:4567 stop:4917 length:351 start_codon:yes stop_codon:yes gene_type:complete
MTDDFQIPPSDPFTQQFAQENQPQEHSQPQPSQEQQTSQPVDPRMEAMQRSQQTLISAIEAYFVSEKAKGLANLNTYMVNSAGIGEHPDVVTETIKLIEQITHADGCIQGLRRIMT